MAQRDKTQGFGFVYVDARKLLEQTKESGESPSLDTSKVASINFNKDPRPQKPQPTLKASEIPPGKEAKDKNAAIQQIRDNLDRLQTLHHKLHSILEDLNKLSDPKKK